MRPVHPNTAEAPGPALPADPHGAAPPDPNASAAGPEDRPLPPTYYRLLEYLPEGLEHEDRIRWLIEHLATLGPAERDTARAYYGDLARRMIDLDASDLDLGGPASNGAVWYRVDGSKRPYPPGTLTLDESDLLALSLLTPAQQQRLTERFSLDFGFALDREDGEPGRRFRSTIYYDNGHLALCTRLLAHRPRSLRSLGFHPTIERGFLFRHVRDGLTLFTGVTGSGKSTTLDAIVDANNDDAEGHVLILAQPLEYVHTSRKCIIRHREVGKDVASFTDGMVQGLRQDPDVVVVGEMRDAETITTAMEMADTGHKVFSTLHTGSAIESVERIVAEYPSNEQERARHRLADVLRCIVSQKLIPAIGGGRVLAKEVLWVTPPAKAAIKKGNTNEIYQMIWQGGEQGMTTLEQDLARLLQTGDITYPAALSYANNKRRFLSLVR